MASKQVTHEQYVRENVERVYGAGSTVQIEKDESGGQIRILGPSGKRVTGWYWSAASASQRTQDQAWTHLADVVHLDGRAR